MNRTTTTRGWGAGKNMVGSRVPLGRTLAMLVLLGTVLAAAPGASANVRIEGAGQEPFYARIDSGGIVPNDGELAAIVFYRPPACVRADFNLLDFFDIPGAFFCGPATTTGFTIWNNGPGLDPAPLHAMNFGLGDVPVWFVSWPELQAAMGDGILTIGELAALPSLLVGSANSFQQVLHPHDAASVPKLNFVASGTLEDGRSFRVQHVRTDAPAGFRERTSIRIR
jgi:hypothetical protein